MRRTKKEENKILDNRGKGPDLSYKSWIRANEFSSLGATCTLFDYKTGRYVELLSQGEKYYWYLLRWNDEVEAIYEQYPISLDLSTYVAEQLNIKHPKNKYTYMTTDLLVSKNDGKKIAYSVKNSRESIQSKRKLEKLKLEKTCWELMGVEFHILFKEDVNQILVTNIIDVTDCYSIYNPESEIDVLRHKIAHKEIKVDMEKKLLDYRSILANLERS